MIPYGHQDINQTDIDAVVDVLSSEFLTQGSAVPAFEQNIANYCSVQHAIAVNSATSALHIACVALGVTSGDIVWTTPITFVGSANCALYCGANVDFVDIDPLTYNISVDCLAKKLEQAQIKGNLPKVVIPVHFAGQPCDMSEIFALSKQYNFKIIEDASHAIGGRYNNEPIGSCKFSEITVFSFHPVKIITTGEGGMALTNDADIANKMRLLRSHGITKASAEMTEEPDGPWYYQQIELGFNYRMTDLQAALGLSQMERLDEFVSKRHSFAKVYNEQLASLSLTIPYQESNNYSSFHLYVIRLDLSSIHKTPRRIFDDLRAENIGVNLHYIPVYRQPYFQQMGFKVGYCPQAEKYYTEAISLPLYPTMSEEQQGKVIKSLKKVIQL